VIKIAPSILSSDFSRLGDEVRAVEAAGADWIHLDVMDGHFVPNLTIGPTIVAAVRKVTDLTLDTHLMIEHPEDFVGAFAEAGSDLLSVHAEACADLTGTIELIRKHGMKPAVVINPETPVERVVDVLPRIELLLIMSVNPGFGAQQFIDGSTDKLRQARKLRDDLGLSFLLEIDGGIKVDNADLVAGAGAEVLVSGSGIFKTSSYKDTIAAMRRAAEKGASQQPHVAPAATAS
jgi:ribulose-phosphate 3-epimerase